MAYTVDGGKFAKAQGKSIEGFQELNKQSRELNQIDGQFGITSYLSQAKTYISNAINIAKTIKTNEEATLGRLLALDKNFNSEYFSYLNKESLRLNNLKEIGYGTDDVLLQIEINQRAATVGLYNMYSTAIHKGMLDEEGRDYWIYYGQIVSGYDWQDYLLSLDVNDPLYKETTHRYYNCMRSSLYANPNLTDESIKNNLLNNVDSTEAKAMLAIDYMKENSRLEKEMTKYEKPANHYERERYGLGSNYNKAEYNGLKADYFKNQKNYNKDILGYSDDSEIQKELQNQIDAATHFKNAAEMRSRTIFDFGGKAKAEEIRGKQALGLATPEEIEYANASEGERFWSDAKTVAFSWVEGGAKFFENIMDGGLSLFSGAGQFVGADTSGLDFFIKTDLSELGYQNLAMNTGVLDRNSSLHYRHVGYSETVTNAAAVVAVSCFAPEAAAPLILGGIGFAHGAGSTYEQALNSGKTGREALLYAYGNGAIEAAGDALCAKTFSSDIIKTQGLKSYVAKSLVPRATYTVAAPVASEGLSMVFDGDFDYKSVIKNEVKSVATFAISEYINAKKAYNSKEAKINRLFNGSIKEENYDRYLEELIQDEEILNFLSNEDVVFDNPEEISKRVHKVFGGNHEEFIDEINSKNEYRKAWRKLSKEQKQYYTEIYDMCKKNPNMMTDPSMREAFVEASNFIENKGITFKAIKDNVLKTYYSSKDKGGFLYNFIKKVKTPALSLPRDSALEILMDTDE